MKLDGLMRSRNEAGNLCHKCLATSGGAHCQKVNHLGTVIEVKAFD